MALGIDFVTGDVDECHRRFIPSRGLLCRGASGRRSRCFFFLELGIDGRIAKGWNLTSRGVYRGLLFFGGLDVFVGWWLQIEKKLSPWFGTLWFTHPKTNMINRRPTMFKRSYFLFKIVFCSNVRCILFGGKNGKFLEFQPFAQFRSLRWFSTTIRREVTKIEITQGQGPFFSAGRNPWVPSWEFELGKPRREDFPTNET